MNRTRASSRPGSAAAVIATLIGALLIGQVGVIVARGGRAPAPAAGSAVAVGELPLHKVLPTPPTTSAPERAGPQSPAQEPSSPASDDRRLLAFGGLGAWVDVYDFKGLDPAAAITDMAARGVRTLYVQTGRYNTPTAVAPEAGAWLVAAHAAGVRVVGWYLPGYRRVAHDVRRTVAIATYQLAGQRFDGLGIDIEFKNLVRHVPTWNERVARHARLVRARLGAAYPIAAITPPPLQMDVAPWRWAGFPWRDLAGSTDLIMLMNYWSFRDCRSVRAHCAGPFTARNVRQTRLLAGDRDFPVHVIGGVGDAINARQLTAFARAALGTDAFGASLYDYATTRAAFWAALARLTDL